MSSGPQIHAYIEALIELSARTLNSFACSDATSGLVEPADVWLEHDSKHGVDHIFGTICRNFDAAMHPSALNSSLEVLWEEGHKLASSICESQQVSSAVLQSDRCRAFAVLLGMLDDGRGRRLRMELLAAGWLILYYHGRRNDALSAGVLRLASVQSALPYGLCFWLGFGLILDTERYQLANRMTCGDIYSVRRRPVLIWGNAPDDTSARDPNVPAEMYEAREALERLGQLYGLLQAALWLRRREASRDELMRLNAAADLPEYHLIHEVIPEDLDQALKDKIAKRMATWRKHKIHFKDCGQEEFQRIGSGLIGTIHGIGYFGGDETSSTRFEASGKKLIEYRGYLIEREGLYQRRAMLADLVKETPSSKEKVE
jgi:hypothetical protein